MRQLLHFVTFEGSPPQLLLLLALLLSLRLHFIILPPLHFHLFIFCTCSTIPLHSIKIKIFCNLLHALYLAFQDHPLDLLDLFTLQVHLKRRVSLHLFRLPWLTSPIIIPSPRIRLAIRICILHPHLRGHVHLLCKTHIHQLASNIKFFKSPII